MNNSKYDITIIVPVYNSENYVEECIKSILNQKFDINRIQVILINDGSSDRSLDIIKKYERDNIIVVDKKNTGVSDTRNTGLKMADGKYILFLDSDDFISNNTCQLIYEAFEKYNKEANVLVYPIYQYNNKTKKERLINRFKNYESSGIYDLDNYYYLFNPTINIAIVNKYKDNILFDTNFFYHEDEQYSAKLLKNNRKIIYLDKPKYYYRIHESSTSSLKSKPYFSYDQYINLYEYFLDNFLEDGKLPKYIQYSIFNDIKWRVNDDSFFPEHLDDKQYKKELKHIKKIFQYIDDDLIIHDNSQIYLIMYFLRNFKNKKINIELDDGTYKLYYDNKLIFLNNNVEMYMYKYKKLNNKLDICLGLKAPFYGIVDYEIYEVLEYNDKTIENKIDTFDVPLKSYGKDTLSMCENYFEKEYNTNNLKNISYYVKINDKILPTSFSFNKRVPFHKTLKRFVIKNGKMANGITVNNKLKEMKYIGGNYTSENKVEKSIKSDKIYFRKYSFKKDFKPILLQHLRMLKRNYKEYLLRITNKTQKNLYLYIDCYDYIGKAYNQFIFDKEKNDGIKRYYVTTNKSIIDNKNIIDIKSNRYKKLYLKASKIITSNLSANNYKINFKNEYTFVDKFLKETVLINNNSLKFKSYQNLKKYENDINHIIVFNDLEKKALINNYFFKDNDIVVTGNIINQKRIVDKKKLLFYIDYRKYLLTSDSYEVEKEFLKNSLYYQKIKEFFNSEKIIKLLNKNDLYIDVKINDCINSVYDIFKDLSNERIRMVNEFELNEYAALITDISNLDQEFLSYNRPIMYYIFDKEMLNSNLHTMSEIKIDNDLVYGDITYNLKDFEKVLEKLIKNKFKSIKKVKSIGQNINIDDYYDKVYNSITKDV